MNTASEVRTSTTPPSLDFVYGELRRPRPGPGPTKRPLGYDQWEKRYPPVSLIKLTQSTADLLKLLMQQMAAGCPIGRTFMNDVILIWLVDANGNILVSIEELVFNARPQKVPKFQSVPLTKDCDKLGHPSLVLAADARIAGEVRYHSDKSPAIWSINNASWRYGLYEGRTSVQLERVAARFRELGINLVSNFLPPKTA
jgi:hypothetical protein